ncbi:MAG: DmsC/YnfH family molybdoenzyme membrane anchor subunit [Actinomycetota bacterium]|nr:DmsC/YnfH family molybdoenzyme membrane anchor subunit [Actinomycetota bacterium]
MTQTYDRWTPASGPGTDPTGVDDPYGAPDTSGLRTPIDRYLAEQHDLSAVERFSRHHDGAGHDLVDGDPSAELDRPFHEDWYRALMPASPPGPGEQYRFEVDLAACTSCKSCVAACHSLNGLDEGESWRRTGTLVGVGPAGPTQQTVTTACHHCVDPACLNGCPVDAYDKDPVTGIVHHLDDQCIGCSYCTFTCPYDVPRFNERLGIVRKCDMCAGRLAEGEAPACVQACPTGAISIGVVDVDELVRATAADQRLVPGAPSSSVTVPTTRYVQPATLPDDALAGDHWSEAPAHAHRPLVLMLVLTQLSVGAFGVLTLLDWLRGDDLAPSAERWTATMALGLGLLALGASIGHLGRPLQAWRAVIGVGHSWLSREIVVFGLFAPLAAGAAAMRWFDAPDGAALALAAAASATGLAGVACSALIYAVTRRRWWRLDRTARGFAGTTVTCGLAVVLAAVVASPDASSVFDTMVRPLALTLAAATAAVLAGDAVVLRPGGPTDPYLARAARLLRGPLAGVTMVRFHAALVGGIALPLLLVAVSADEVPSIGAARVAATLALVLVVVAELAGRELFFRAQTAPRMPGTPR